MSALPEVWLRGPIEGYPASVQPIAHALLQAQEEIHSLMKDFPETLLWERPTGLASVGFHLLHIPGVLDRMSTYAKAITLNESQFQYLKNETETQSTLDVVKLLDNLDIQIDLFLFQLSQIDTNRLTEFRAVGRAALPSTLGGLLFHAAEHTQRHLGQLLVTVKILKAKF